MDGDDGKWEWIKRESPFFYIFLVVALEKSQWGSNQPRLWQREANNVHAHAAPTNDFKLVWHESSMSRGCLLNIGMTWARQLLLSIRRCCCINDKRRSIPVCCLVIASSPLSLSLSLSPTRTFCVRRNLFRSTH